MKRATKARGFTDLETGISIHALVKRATADSGNGGNNGSISIHALVKRATGISSLFNVLNTFQSTPS